MRHVISFREHLDVRHYGVACPTVVAGVLLSSMALAGLSGCASSVPEEGAYAAEIAQAFDNAESDYVRELLGDGLITAVEVRDSQDHDVACLREAGINASYVDNEAGYKSLVILDARDDMLSEQIACSDKWVGEVHDVYNDQITNPENGDFEALIAKCLVAKGPAPEGFSGSDDRELMDKSGTKVTISEAGSVAVPERDPVILPGGESLNNPKQLSARRTHSRLSSTDAKKLVRLSWAAPRSDGPENLGFRCGDVGGRAEAGCWTARSWRHERSRKVTARNLGDCC